MTPDIEPEISELQTSETAVPLAVEQAPATVAVDPTVAAAEPTVAVDRTVANRAVVENAVRSIGAGNLDETAKFVAPELTGVVRQFSALAHTVFPDLDVTLEDTIAAGDKVVYRWSARGTHQGTATYRSMGEIAATGRKIDVQGITILQVADGKIVGTWGITDEASGLEQLGLLGSRS